MPDNGKLLIVENGVYGERMAQIASRMGISFTIARHGWTSPVDTASLASQLDREPTLSHVAVVHHETTTGRLNDLAGIQRLCAPESLRFFG